jgi:hypothetical protein
VGGVSRTQQPDVDRDLQIQYSNRSSDPQLFVFDTCERFSVAVEVVEVDQTSKAPRRPSKRRARARHRTHAAVE